MMNINFYVNSIGSFIILSVIWYERLTKCYLLHTDLSEFRELGKTCQVTSFPLSKLNCWSFIEHTSWSSKSQLPKFLQWDSWAWIMSQKWDDMPWAWTMGFDVFFLCKYGLFWALKAIFPKFIIMLMWCGLPMKWNHVVWKICPQQRLLLMIAMSFTLDDSSLSLDQDTNQFLV